MATGVTWQPDSRNTYRITTVLKQLGYTRGRRRRGVANRKWLWLPPRDLLSDADPDS